MAQAEVISVEQDVSVEEELPFMVLSFIEVAVHGLLHARQVYPNRRNENMAARKFTVHDHHAWVPHAELFERRRAYGCAVWMSRHPELNDYIHKALFKAKAFMDAGTFRAVHVAILGPSGSAVEQFSLDATFTAELDVPCTAEDLLQAFAAALMKVQQSTTHLGPPPQDTTFSLLVETAPVDASAGGQLPATSPATADGVTDDHDTYWSRVGWEDPEASIAKVGPLSTVGVPLKHVQAGKMRMRLSGASAAMLSQRAALQASAAAAPDVLDDEVLASLPVP